LDFFGGGPWPWRASALLLEPVVGSVVLNLVFNLDFLSINVFFLASIVVLVPVPVRFNLTI